MSQEPLSEAIRALSQFLVADVSIGETLQRVAQISQQAVPAALYVGISMLDAHGEATTAVFTDESAPEIDQAQYETGDGPCLTSWHQRRVVRVDDTGSPDGRFVAFCRAAAAHGIASTMSMPLVAAGEGIGALNLYSDRVRGFSSDDEEVAGQLTTTAAVVLANAAAFSAAYELTEDMRSAMETRALIDQARGLLMAESPGTDAAAAFDAIRRSAESDNRKLRDVAREIIERHGRASEQRRRVLNEERLPVTWQELRAAREMLGLSTLQTWLAYFSMGGSGTIADVETWLDGTAPIPPIDHDYLAAGLNDIFIDRGLGRPVRSPTDQPEP